MTVVRDTHSRKRPVVGDTHSLPGTQKTLSRSWDTHVARSPRRIVEIPASARPGAGDVPAGGFARTTATAPAYSRSSSSTAGGTQEGSPLSSQSRPPAEVIPLSGWHPQACSLKLPAPVRSLSTLSSVGLAQRAAPPCRDWVSSSRSAPERPSRAAVPAGGPERRGPRERAALAWSSLRASSRRLSLHLLPLCPFSGKPPP